MPGAGHPFGLPQARLHRFIAFGGLAIFLGCLLCVLSVVALGRGTYVSWCLGSFGVMMLSSLCLRLRSQLLLSTED
jgi:hypothetical protein